VLTNLEQIESPIDVIAVWEGGLQFTGGFVAAALLAPVLTRSWPKGQRWVFLDGAVLGLAIGQMIGRIGCYAVGEHLGGETDFFLGVTYQGGDTIEGPLEVGVTYHNTALYEFLWLIPIIVILLVLDRRGVRPGIMTGTFAVLYATMRFLTDFLRTFDTTFAGLTGAQYASMALLAVGIAILATTSRRDDPAVATTEGDTEASIED
jgi:phosphatidylglycerol:prolipoprotein diacylglycerol transferase